MKYRLSNLLFFLFISFWANCFTDCHLPNDEAYFIPCPKTSVTPDQITFYENAIFVQINGLILQTECLSTDAQGIFFSNAKDNRCGPLSIEM